MSVAVLINRKARRGSERVAKLTRQLLPDARVAVTHSLEDAQRWIDQEIAPNPPDVLLAGGGDGTTIGLLNELRRVRVPFPIIGVLPLGTGNAWARETHAPPAPLALSRLAKLRGAIPPARHFHLVETEGKLTHFAGTGWDAELISDYHSWQASQLGLARRFSGGLVGYMGGLFTRTIPRHLGQSGPPHVVVTNLGPETWTVDEAGNLLQIPGAKEGRVLYEGPASVAAAATTPQWGFGFRAFPFADRVGPRLSVRVYGAQVIEATRQMFDLWKGKHPINKMYDFFVTHARMTFDQDVPFQIGGDLAGMRRELEFKIDVGGVKLLDWAGLTEPSSAR
jgi:hypothetical protein